MHTLLADDTSLRRTLARLLTQVRGRSVEISGLTREPSAFVTLFPAEILGLTLDDGETTRIFLKHLGSEQSEHPEKKRRDRELRVYEELLRVPGLPVVDFYGGRWNSTSGRYELYLEYVDDWSLKYQELQHWYEAARRLAELHAYFAARADCLTHHDFLLRLDAEYFQGWADRALVSVGRHAPTMAAELQPIVAHYDGVASLLSSQPPTLVHNDLAPKNVIADRSARPTRICFVDWEMAGVGCGPLDLVDLKYGLDDASDERMCAAYADAIGNCGVLPRRSTERRRLFAACELHKTLYRLAFGEQWKVPCERLEQWAMDAVGWWLKLGNIA